MKIVRFAGAVALAAAAPALADTYGNTTPFETQSGHSPNYILGVQVAIPVNDFQLTSFGMMYGHPDLGNPSDSNAVFGLYTSGSDGMPDALVAATDAIFLANQQTYDNIPFTSAPVVDAGTYWMMALYEENANPRMSAPAPDSLVAYWWNPYANGMPANSSNVESYYGQNFNYWINGTVVPAPGALALLGLAGLAAHRRR